MATTLELEKAQNSTRHLLRLVRQRDNADGDAGDVEALANLGSMLAHMIQHTWGAFLARLNDPMEAEKVRTRGADYSSAARDLIKVMEDIQKLGNRVAQKEGRSIKGLAELTTERDRLTEIDAAARRVIDAINGAGQGAIPETCIAKANEEFAAGQVRTGKEVVAKLRTRKCI